MHRCESIVCTQEGILVNFWMRQVSLIRVVRRTITNFIPLLFYSSRLSFNKPPRFEFTSKGKAKLVDDLNNKYQFFRPLRF